MAAAVAETMDILEGNRTGLADSCSKCIATLTVCQMVAKLVPTYAPDAMISLCKSTDFGSSESYKTTYDATIFGASWTQILATADVTGLDGCYICA